MTISSIVRGLSPSFQIVLADIGSAGGLHKRWKPVRSHVSAVLFDPLDKSAGGERDRYFPVAVAKGQGRATIYVTRRVTMTSALLPNAPLLGRFWDKPEHTEVVSTLEVPTDSLDAVMDRHAISLDVIKIDVQGGEYDILSGARSALANSVFLAEVEVSFLERYRGLRTFDAVVSLMRESGFELIDVSRIKRYRYRNSFSVINPGLGMGDRAGRIAFCDAIFLLNDDALVDRILKSGKHEQGWRALKAIIVLLIYGKADLAAWIFDKSKGEIELEMRVALSRYFKGLSGVRFDLSGVHRALDYLARRV